MKLHVWFDKTRHEYLLCDIYYEPAYLMERFPHDDIVERQDIEVRTPTIKRLAERILEDQNFLWMHVETFEDLKKEDEEFHKLCHEKEKQFADDLEHYFVIPRVTKRPRHLRRIPLFSEKGHLPEEIFHQLLKEAFERDNADFVDQLEYLFHAAPPVPPLKNWPKEEKNMREPDLSESCNCCGTNIGHLSMDLVSFRGITLCDKCKARVQDRYLQLAGQLSSRLSPRSRRR